MPAIALLASNIIMFSVIVALAAYFYRRLRRLERSGDRMTTLYLEQLQHQVSAQQRDLRSLAERMERQQNKEDNPRPSAASPYQQALELIRQGLTAVDVAERCGISRSEAELIVSLYRNNSTS